jgi:hypothetical protein
LPPSDRPTSIVTADSDCDGGLSFALGFSGDHQASQGISVVAWQNHSHMLKRRYQILTMALYRNS